ncbi:MAG: hypothetical protein E7214_08200 [Clostridium sp.]|nr:hypothetical protein [Clostridium sp.]
MNKLQESVLTDETVEREGFKIDSLEGATWAFRKLRALSEKQEEAKKIADEEIAKIEAWRDNEIDAYANDKNYFEGLLTEYYVKERAKDKKFKLSTPYGKVTSRKTKKWVYESEEQLLKYCKDNKIPAVRVKEELDKAGLKKLYKDGVNAETGELLPFIHIDESTSITVKVE